jgi:hypothetical protein
VGILFKLANFCWICFIKYELTLKKN